MSNLSALPSAKVPTTEAKMRPPTAGARLARRLNSLGAYYVASVLGGFAIWWFAAAVGTSELLPTPAAIFARAAETIADGSLANHTLTSLRRVLLGFALGVSLAIPAGFLMGWYRWARGAFEPWVQFFRTIPPIALIPLVVLTLGIGETPKVFVITLAAFLAAVIATFQGVVNVDLTLINAARVLGAGDRALFRRVVVPASAPYIMVGMRIALGNAWGTLVAAELIAAQAGLGYLTQRSALYFDISSIFVGILTIGVLGVAMDRVIVWIDRRVTSWQERR